MRKIHSLLAVKSILRSKVSRRQAPRGETWFRNGLEAGPTIVGHGIRETKKLDVRPKVRGGNGKGESRTKG